MRWVVPFALMLQGAVLCAQTSPPPARSKPGAVVLLSVPDAGTVQGNTYSNPSAGFSLNFPSTWKPVQAFVGGYTPATRFTKLFAVGESVENWLQNWLLISSFKPSQAGADGDARMTAYFLPQMLQSAGYSVEPKAEEVKISGKKLFRLNYSGKVADLSFYCALFITGHSKNVLLFEYCASDKPALGSAVTTLQSLNFTKPAKGK